MDEPSELFALPIVQNVKRLYENPKHTKLYEMDVKSDLPFIVQRVAVLSTWNPQLQTFGKVNSSVAIIADNNYISSLAYNIALIFLSRAIAPDDHDYEDLLVGNFKRYFSEQLYHMKRNEYSISGMIEYLYEYDHLNRRLLETISKHDHAREQLTLLGKMSGNLMLVHEIAHLVYGRGVQIYPEGIQMRAVAMPGIHAFVSEHFPHKAKGEDCLLYEEIFCDLFAVINVIGDHAKLGWSRQEIAQCLSCLQISAFCLFFAREFVSTEGAGKLDLSDNELIIRHLAVSKLVNDELQSADNDDGKGVGFKFETNEVMNGFMAASRFPVKSEDIRRMSRLLAQGFVSNGPKAFDGVIDKCHQTFDVSSNDFISELSI